LRRNWTTELCALIGSSSELEQRAIVGHWFENGLVLMAMIRCSRRLSILTLALVSSGFTSAHRDWAHCSGNDPQLKLASCARIIKNQGEDRRKRIRAYNFRANAWRLTGKFDAALADYNEAIRLDHTYAFPHNGRGLTWRLMGDTRRALADFDEAIKLNPKYSKTFNNRAEIWRIKGELDRAIDDLNEAIRLEPNYFLAHFNRGLALQAKGNFDLAILDFSRAINIEPTDAFSFFHRGLTWRAEGEIDKAMDDFNRAISFDPMFGMAFFNRGLVSLYSKESLERALADINTASELEPNNAYIGLWRYIVGLREGVEASFRLNAASASNMSAWPGPMLRLFLDQLTPDELIVETLRHDPDGKAGEMCEANFYGGMALKGKQSRESAEKFLRVAVDGCQHFTIEWYAASAELKQLER
jgi:lipoprotein NlpI